jgi:ketosteroid isomerase-like protein
MSLEQRVQKVEDILQIQRLANDYGRLLDQRDFAAFAALFAEDGEILLGPVARAAGPAEVQRAMEAALPGPPGEDVHIIGTPMVELDGDTATSEVMWTVVRRGPDGSPVVSMVGRHRDDLVRQGDQWRIKRRRGFVDIPTAVAPRDDRS